MLIIIPSNMSETVTVIRTMNADLAVGHAVSISTDGNILKDNYLIHKNTSDKTWSRLDHPGMTNVLVQPDETISAVLNMPAVECIANVTEDAGVWNVPTGGHSNNLMSNIIAVIDGNRIDSSRTVFMQDIHAVNEYVPVWAASYVWDYYNSAFTDLEVSLTSTILHMHYKLQHDTKELMDEIVLIDPDEVSAPDDSDTYSVDTSFAQESPDYETLFYPG
jgi:hypothetical protein